MSERILVPLKSAAVIGDLPANPIAHEEPILATSVVAESAVSLFADYLRKKLMEDLLSHAVA
jgi:hypothetical protein